MKVNVIVQLEFELTYSEAAIQRVRCYAMRTPPDYIEEN